MNDVNALWKQRVQQYVADTRKYLKYMLNDHLKIVLIFILGGAAYYYQLWLEELSPSFPAAFLMAGIMGIVLTTGGIRTFFKQADIVFLLPLEQRMIPYLIKSFFFSFTSQIYVLLITVAALAPLYVKVTGQAYGSIVKMFIFFLVVKLANAFMSWHITYFEDPSARRADYVVRFALNSVFAYLLFVNAHFPFLLTVAVLIAGLAYYYYALTKKKPLKWEHLIELETKRMMFFYRLANLFTDVPNIKEKVVRRAYMDWLLNRIPFVQSASYHYLYSRTFLRAGDYLGLVIRLTIIGGLVLWNAPLQYGNIIVAVAVIYLTGFQLIPLWKHHEYKLWVSLYPIKDTDREKAFLSLLQIILGVQAILLSLFVVLKNVFTGSVVLLIGLLFSQLFAKIYIRSKLKKM
ncbi:MAG TPA: ABC transporter permease [Bacillus sp. (in: firmicutes)]|nr:ABC transporter permease [Bacillus sp. (in: firmicutes)]